MKIIVAIVLIVLGGVLFFQGLNRKDSLVGHADAAGTNIANAVDGGGRTPKHVIYMIVGGALILVGIGAAVRRSSAGAR
jgi:hypothetical protein